MVLSANSTRAALLVALAAIAHSPPSQADIPEVSGTGKALVGGGLLGAELFVGTEALAGVRSPWVFGAGALAGCVGGTFAGFYLQRSVNEQTSMLMLTAGMLLAIPTTVVVMSATAYHSPEPSQDSPESYEPPADTGSSVEEPPTHPKSDASLSVDTERVGQPIQLLPALVGFTPEGLSLGFPTVGIRPAFTPREAFEQGVDAGTSVEFLLLAGAF